MITETYICIHINIRLLLISYVIMTIKNIMFKQLIVFAFIAVFLGLSQTAGVGGGPIVNICLMISMGYDAKLSISITYIFLIGGSMASIWKNAQKKNPKTGASYVNLDLILLTIPTMSSGSLFGGVIKNFVSEAIITLMFITLFVYLIYDLRRTLNKFKQQNNASLLILKSQIKQPKKIQYIEFLQKQKPPSPTPQPDNPITTKINLTIKLITGYYIFTVLISLIRGGAKYDSMVGMDPCGGMGWFMLGLHLAVSGFVSVRIANYIKEGAANSRNFGGESMEVNEENVWYFLTAGFCAGVVGATLAIGGALILIPVWLKVGIDKNVAASSTAPLILTSALVAFTIACFNSIYSQVSLPTILFYLLLAFASAAIVKDIVVYLADKYKLKSLVVVLLLVVVIISLVTLVPYQMVKMVGDYEDFVEFGDLC